MTKVTVNKTNYVTLHQWDLNRELAIHGAGQIGAPEVHFAYEADEAAIVRSATVDEAGVIRVGIPNSLLQRDGKLCAYLCTTEGEKFQTLHKITIPVRRRSRPADYTELPEVDVYSMEAIGVEVVTLEPGEDAIVEKVLEDGKLTYVFRIPRGEKGESGEAADAKYFDIDEGGLLSLKPEYRGSPADGTYSFAVSDRGFGMDGSLNIVLPEKIVLPKAINGKVVAGFQKGMFCCNQRVKEIIFPDTVTAIPEAFSMTAYNLCDITNTDHMTSVGKSAFESTRIRAAMFPLLSEIGDRAFCFCMYLQIADIGAQITAIPDSCFRMDISLATVKGGDSVTAIMANAFRATYKLKWMPLIENVTLLGDYAFIISGFPYDWDELGKRCTFGTLSTPVQDNGSNTYWVENGKDVWAAGVESGSYKAAKVPIITALSQRDPRWVEKKWGTTTQPYSSGCGVIVAMHIHSIFSGKMYNTPQEFEADIKAINPDLLGVKTTGAAKPVNDLLVALGYNVEMITATLATTHLKKLYAALSGGDCAVFTMNSSTSDTAHWVVAYGVTADGQIMVLNSDCGSHLIDVYDDVELMTHTAPLQNITGKSSDIIIVKKP